jgi:hypothetical protein
MWADNRCREIRLAISTRNHEQPKPEESGGARVGSWVVLHDIPGQCGNAVLGTSRCLAYGATSRDGMLGLDGMGFDRLLGDRMVSSIPL